MEAALNAALAPYGLRIAGPLHYQHRSWVRRKLDDFVVWAGSKSAYLSGKVIEEFAGGVAFTAPANVYLALLTVTPTDASTSASSRTDRAA
jgi:hypothetical protein